ncbi:MULTISPECIES: IS66 family insertion sequence element accessory protein TnpA [Acetivibrio]|jgi:putative transposase|uniref:IS66 family insertion sequence element accessory protein TnpA n=1 Tax=Acetivibrio TaxID=35829 RepID=UPI00223EC470|nr:MULTISPECIES: transposase [Acetivibrio]HOM02684.1 transposase [Acetivibrio sp.]
MDTQKVAAEYRLSQWAQVIQAQQESGQSVKDFCKTAGISRNAYFYWQKKLRKAACTEFSKTEEPSNIVPSGWMQLTPKQAQHAKETLGIEINGCHVAVNDETDLELLKKVCRVLRSL